MFNSETTDGLRCAQITRSSSFSSLVVGWLDREDEDEGRRRLYLVGDFNFKNPLRTIVLMCHILETSNDRCGKPDDAGRAQR
jgi:hypothetical protein